MESNDLTRSVVVGTDGSPAARHALIWAAREAARLDATLRIVHVWNPAVLAPWGGMGAAAIDPTLIEDGSRSIVEAGERAVTDALGDAAPPIVLTVAQGHAVSVLVDLATDAELLVVGTRGRNEFLGALLGSVSTGCAQHSTVPVAVVGDEPPADGDVVVGVDGSDQCRDALRYAATVASGRGGVLRVRHAWSPDLADPVGGPASGGPVVDVADPTPDVERFVASVLGDIADQPPITVEIVGLPAAANLAPENDGVSLLVVGTRGHGGFVGMLLGSVSSKVLHRSACPVVVVPSKD